MDAAGRGHPTGSGPSSGDGRSPPARAAGSRQREHRRRGVEGARRLPLLLRCATAADHGPRRPGRSHVARRGPARGRLAQGQRLARLLRARACEGPRAGGRARRRVPRQPALDAQPRDHRPPARGLPDGPVRRRGRGRFLRPGVQPSRPARGRRRGDAGTRRRQPEPHDRRSRRPLRRRDARGRAGAGGAQRAAARIGPGRAPLARTGRERRLRLRALHGGDEGLHRLRAERSPAGVRSRQSR